MGSAAQWERRIISERTKEVAVKRAQGVRLGRPSVLAPELVERIVREHRDGASFSAIPRTLADDDVPTAHGGSQWWPATIRKVLKGQDAALVSPVR
jgi:DNA invertase Pin-like site-specific DNA recombinase